MCVRACTVQFSPYLASALSTHQVVFITSRPTHPCEYSSETFTQEEGVALENTDYMMQTSYPSPTIYNASTYNGTLVAMHISEARLRPSERW